MGWAGQLTCLFENKIKLNYRIICIISKNIRYNNNLLLFHNITNIDSKIIIDILLKVCYCNLSYMR